VTRQWQEKHGELKPPPTCGSAGMAVDPLPAAPYLLPVAIDADVEEEALMQLARRHRLTVYDTAYLELALRQGHPLATLDAALSIAAPAERVPLIGDVQT
jgi:hypothetical protein